MGERRGRGKTSFWKCTHIKILCCVLSKLTVIQLNLQCTLLVIASRFTPSLFLFADVNQTLLNLTKEIAKLKRELDILRKFVTFFTCGAPPVAQRNREWPFTPTPPCLY